MTIGEMHISVQHGVDKISSVQSDLLLTEEIDLELNKNIQRFINHRFNSRGNRYQVGFEQSQKRLDDLRSLVVEDSQITAFKGQVFDNTFVDAAFLPDDYLHLVNAKSLNFYQNCKTYIYAEAVGVIGNVKAEFDLRIPAGWAAAFSDYDQSYLAITINGISIPITTPINLGAVQSLINFKNHILNPLSWIPGFIDSIVSVVGNVVVLKFKEGIDATLPEVRHMGVGPIWGSNPGSILSVATAFLTPNSVFANRRINGVDSSLDPLPYKTTVGKLKFVQHDDLFQLLSDPFNTTTLSAPLFSIKDNIIEVYTDTTFIVDRVKMTYIRKPAVVDAISTPTVDCDLPANVHQEIVDMTVASILEAFTDPRYQSMNMEVLKSE